MRRYRQFWNALTEPLLRIAGGQAPKSNPASKEKVKAADLPFRGIMRPQATETRRCTDYDAAAAVAVAVSTRRW